MIQLYAAYKKLTLELNICRKGRIEKIFQPDNNKKSPELAILIPDKIYFKSKLLEETEGYYILIKVSIDIKKI